MEEVLLNIVKERGIVKMIDEYKSQFDIVCLFERLMGNRREYYEMNEDDWKEISKHKGITEEFIREFQNDINWNFVSKFQREKLSLGFIREFQDKLNWKEIFRSPRMLTRDFITEFRERIDWDDISEYHLLSEDFIREFQHNVFWGYISVYQKLSENFIREFRNRVDWLSISANQQLSENFIREFRDDVNWTMIQTRLKLKKHLVSREFVTEFRDRLSNWDSN